MARIAYIPKRFSADRLDMIRNANAICAQYQAQGLQLTLRQLYYQFVARDLLPNKQSEYKRLGDTLNDARMAGEMDWDYLVDRTRNLESLAHWESPAEIIEIVSRQYRTDRWADQGRRVEVWIEKDAGIGVIEGVCEANDVPYFSCRGYTSVSEIHAAAQRLRGYMSDEHAAVTILHIGDHDPSGLDMSRDIRERLERFILTDWAREAMGWWIEESFEEDRWEAETHLTEWVNRDDDGNERDEVIEEPLEVRRIALNYNQVQQYNPPPNPAKTTDARFQKYVRETGLHESWELDALDPAVLAGLIQAHINSIRDEDKWRESTEKMNVEKSLLAKTSEHWAAVVSHVEGLAS